MKTYLPSLLILTVMAASAAAMPPGMKPASGSSMMSMKMGSMGAAPTAKSHEKLIADLKLTDKETEPVRKILAQYRKELAKWAAKNGPELAACQASMKKYHKMRDPKVMVEIRKAMARQAELKKEKTDMREAMLVKLKGAMTKEQFAQAAGALRPLRAPRGKGFQERYHVLGKMGFSKEKMDRVIAITKEAMKPPADGSPRKGNPMDEAWTKILKEVMTEKDREKFKDLEVKAKRRKMVLGFLDRIELTEEQSKQVDAIWDKAHEDAKKAPKTGQFEIYRKAMTDITEKVITKEQKDQLSKKPSGRPSGGMMGHKPKPKPKPIKIPDGHTHAKDKK
jgi:hypothetical protein